MLQMRLVLRNENKYNVTRLNWHYNAAANMLVNVIKLVVAVVESNGILVATYGPVISQRKQRVSL